MKSSIADFHAGIDQLLVFLETTACDHELVAGLRERYDGLSSREQELVSQLVTAARDTKQYIYSVAIVSLYGLLERVVDSLISGFAIRLGQISALFTGLPDAIVKNHLPYSLALANALINDRFRTDSTHQQVIANLHSCLSAEKDYKLNGNAFSLHRGNVNLGRITEMLNGVGVQHHLRALARTSAFSEYCERLELSPSEHSPRGDELALIFEPIDDLVDRRNRVSHGVLQLDNIESIDLLKDRCVFVRAYGAALFELLQKHVFKYAAENGVAQSLGRPIQVHNNEIVCFEGAFRIGVGDHIFCVMDDLLTPVRAGTVKSLQIKHVDMQQIDSQDPIQFAAKVGFYADDRYAYYSLPADWH